MGRSQSVRPCPDVQISLSAVGHGAQEGFVVTPQLRAVVRARLERDRGEDENLVLGSALLGHFPDLIRGGCGGQRQGGFGQSCSGGQGTR